MTVFLAHDGSLNGDWIARYALHFAAGSAARRLVVVHVEDANISGEPLHARLESLTALGERMNVGVEVRILPMHAGVFGGLDDYLREQEDALVVTGARVAGGRRGHLRGTISEKLLRQSNYGVVAIHVMQPGLLGDPKRVLLALTDSAPAPTAILKLFAPAITRLDIVQLETVSRLHFTRLSEAEAAALKRDGLEAAARAEAGILSSTGLTAGRIDTHVRVTNDWPKQVAVEAGRYRAGLALVEMPSATSGTLSFGHPIEELMRIAPSDVAVYREADAS